MNRWQKIVTIMIVLIMSATQTIAQSNHTIRYYQAGSDHPIAAVGRITEQKAIAIALQKFNGRVLAINHSKDIYRIKMLSQKGTVHIILINAIDGAIMSTH